MDFSPNEHVYVTSIPMKKHGVTSVPVFKTLLLRCFLVGGAEGAGAQDLLCLFCDFL